VESTRALDSPAMEGVRAPLHEELLGRSARIREVNTLIRRLAASELTVLITGESGTGKDIAARLLHKLSPRYGKPFIKVNCPAIPESILESELFGYERGAFTGARSSKPGRFELANHGTIFLDEIAETSLSVQGKLLQVLDGEPFMRIGGTTPIQTSVRIIGATNIPLEEMVKSGRMREDIYFRLSEVIIHMPALRERPEDIPLLAEHFNYNFSGKLGKTYKPIPPELVEELQRLPWRGNVRELGARGEKVRGDGQRADAPGRGGAPGGGDAGDAGGRAARGSPPEGRPAQEVYLVERGDTPRRGGDGTRADRRCVASHPVEPPEGGQASGDQL
jgi:transcriptional regulator with PAS, ATPase and Fis domain